MEDQYFDVSSRSKSECGLTNGQAVDSPHNALTSNACPDNALTNVSPNVVQQIVPPVHSSHAGFDARKICEKNSRPVANHSAIRCAIIICNCVPAAVYLQPNHV